MTRAFRAFRLEPTPQRPQIVVTARKSTANEARTA